MIVLYFSFGEWLMKLCRKEETIERNNSDNCVVTECPLDDDALNFAIAKINGRYPESGFAINHKSKEIVYVQQGRGTVCVDGQTVELNAGDVVMIEAGEKFFWDGEFTFHIACSPAFTVEQHKHVIS
jgi:quercetin dioxygenase-like cupin family protein